MANLSLRTRSLLLAIVGLLVIVPAILFTVERSYTSSLEQAKYDELKLMSLAMITEFEIDNGNAFMPQQLFEEQLNLPGSGFIGYIIWQNQIVWSSLSSLDYQEPLVTDYPAVGSEVFATLPLESSLYDDARKPAFYFAFSAEYENNGNFEPVTFLVFNEQFEFQQAREMFIQTLGQWLILLSLGMLAIIVFIVRRVLMPVREIIDNIQAAEQGRIERLTATYPPELESLKNSINQLLDSEAQQRQRYKNSLGDLAHSLKTPLAVINTDPSLPKQLNEPLTQIDNIIQRQLKRAVSGQSARLTAVPLAEPLAKLVGAMEKVYADKCLTIVNNVEPQHTVRADQTDLIELLGNVIDNACKSAQTKVAVSAETHDNRIHILVDDDGPGIDAPHADAILNRGQRLDTYSEGQGIGLAVVMDLLESYNGQLKIQTSPHGGARFNLILPI